MSTNNQGPVEIRPHGAVQGRITAERLQRLGALTGATRYLEIGVHEGATFRELDFPVMDAVDPGFKFDTALHARPGRTFHPMASDAFFRMAAPRRTYDLMFIDGLHTFEQTFRDFCATLAYSHDHTIWLIDDTVPEDAFSAMPDAARTYRMRSLHGMASRSWHGDVFKAAFAIHDFFPTFDFRTVTDRGNAQTVILRCPREGFAPRWNNLEQISRLDFEAFHFNRALMNPTTEAEMLAWVRTSLAV